MYTRRTRRTIIGAGLFAALLASDKGLPARQNSLIDFVPRINERSHPAELIRPSTLIVVGTVVHEQTVNRTVAINGGGRATLEKIDVKVEDVLKGHLDSTQISFYRYRWTTNSRTRTPALDAIEPGDRSVFFLETTTSGLRASLDISSSRFKLFTGTHDRAFISGKTIELQIASLMLTPGSGFASAAFEETLAEQSLQALPLVGRTGAIKLLRPLLRNPSNSTRWAACLVLAQWFDGQSACLSEIPRNAPGNYGPLVVQRLREENEKRDASLREDLRKGEIQGIESIAIGKSAAGVCDYLAALANHQDREISKLASQLLGAKFPDAGRAGCPPIL